MIPLPGQQGSLLAWDGVTLKGPGLAGKTGG